ncbi:antibiotic biosynthesis monooxygenase [Virgibacillus halodenitrificans]|uniref:Antibiotic biosynthesis monooxygenase n=1 Tax=Virgibacillus halodenitrificans TaxID=1482 RepID=A0AAC9IXN4_VIRHA|nr:antibiotic biosynthesis monooxygenase family protein [Virgibacillus halodenitrificans]APC47866.1 antibiotic biosynthesis monooxygenase [Virgibacillus halodenitrificans]
MYIVNSTVSVPEDKAEEVIQIYRDRSRMVDKAEGFLSFQLLQNQKKPSELTVHLEWDTRENYLKWARSDEYKQIHELEKKYPDQELAAIIPRVTQYKVVAK